MKDQIEAKADSEADNIMREINDRALESFHFKKCVIRSALEKHMRRIAALEETVELLSDGTGAKVLKEALEAERKKVAELECQLNAWHKTFGTSQLTHAIAVLEAERAHSDSLASVMEQVVLWMEPKRGTAKHATWELVVDKLREHRRRERAHEDRRAARTAEDNGKGGEK